MSLQYILKRSAAICLLIYTAFSLCACSITRLPNNLPAAMAEQSDPDIIRSGAPSYMILMDALIKGSPKNEKYLLGGAKLYGLYASVFTENQPERAKVLSARALGYAKRAVCTDLKELCKVIDKPSDEFNASLKSLDKNDVPLVFGLASAWAGSIQANTDDWLAIAQLPKVKALVQFVIKHNEAYDYGNAHLYMAVLETQLPPSLGGKPEIAKQHFERAIELSDGKNLMAKTLYAKQYARLVYNKTLHQSLLDAVMHSSTEAGELTLPNALAKQQAKALQNSAKNYFE